MRTRIVVASSRLVDESGLTWPTVLAALGRLEKLGIAQEVTGKQRYRVYRCTAQLEILDRETGMTAS